MATIDRPARAVVPEEMKGPAQAFQYSPGIRISGGDLVLISGQVGRDSLSGVVADPEAQFTKAFENLESVLREAGATLGDVVEITTYLTSMEYLPLLARVKERFFTSEPFPAWTGIGISELALPGLLLEVRAAAAVAGEAAAAAAP
jgi:enamine deaminase RidA (YjgF/YER057c/UK114 family)